MTEDTHGAIEATIRFKVTGAEMAGLDKQFWDKAIYHIFADAKESTECVELVGQNVFRPDQVRPRIDELDVKSSVVVDLVRKRG